MRVILVLAALAMIGTAQAAPAHYGHPATWFSKDAPARDKLRILQGRVKHANDVIRFFQNHPGPARSKRGRAVLWQHRHMRSWALRTLREVRTQVYRQTVVIRLERGLQGSPMEGSGKALERAAWRHRISPFFIVAVAATESSIGRAACANNRFNVWGLANCSGIWHVPAFRSWDEAYDFYARYLTERWPDATTCHHYYKYAKCSACWGRKTAAWMRSLFGVGPYVRYATGGLHL